MQHAYIFYENQTTQNFSSHIGNMKVRVRKKKLCCWRIGFLITDGRFHQLSQVSSHLGNLADNSNKLPKKLPPVRHVDHQIKLVSGAGPSNKAT